MALLDRIRFTLRMIQLALRARPIAGGADDGKDGGDSGGADAGADGKDAESAGSGSEGSEDEDKVDHSDRKTWESESRKHERRAKASERRVADLEKQLKEREDASKSENEKAIDKARKEAREEAQAEAEKSRRSDRLEVAVTRAATRGIKAGEETVKFADPDDALANIERAIARGDVDADEIFNSEGAVQTEPLQAALGEILEAKPHLKAGAESGGRPSGSSDAGKGAGGGGDLESMTPEDHFKQISRAK